MTLPMIPFEIKTWNLLLFTIGLLTRRRVGCHPLPPQRPTGAIGVPSRGSSLIMGVPVPSICFTWMPPASSDLPGPHLTSKHLKCPSTNQVCWREGSGLKKETKGPLEEAKLNWKRLGTWEKEILEVGAQGFQSQFCHQSAE